MASFAQLPIPDTCPTCGADWSGAWRGPDYTSEAPLAVVVTCKEGHHHEQEITADEWEISKRELGVKDPPPAPS